MLNPFINLLGNTIHLYMLCVIAWAVLATLISFRIVNGGQPVVLKIMNFLDQIVEPALKPLRKRLPKFNGIDLSPVVLILLLGFLEEALYTYLYNL